MGVTCGIKSPFLIVVFRKGLRYEIDLTAAI